MEGIRFESVSQQEEERLTRAYPALAAAFGFCRGRPGGTLLTKSFQLLGPSFCRLQLRQDDIFIATLPKSGTMMLLQLSLSTSSVTY